MKKVVEERQKEEEESSTTIGFGDAQSRSDVDATTVSYSHFRTHYCYQVILLHCPIDWSEEK